MAAPTSADMDTCDPKCKCSSGLYAGQAFLCDSPCAGQGANCTFDCSLGCICGPCSSRWRVTYTGVSGGSFGCAGCSYTPSFNNLFTFSAPYPGTFSSANYGYINQACGGPPYAGQTAKNVFNIDLVWDGGGWSDGSSYALGSAADMLAFMITVCDGPSAGIIYGQILSVGGGSTGCDLTGQVLVVTDAVPN